MTENTLLGFESSTEIPRPAHEFAGPAVTVSEALATNVLAIIFAPVIAYANTWGGKESSENQEREFREYWGFTGPTLEWPRPTRYRRTDFDDAFKQFNREASSTIQTLVAGINLQWVRILMAKNEMARGVASYMRVNFKQYLKDKTLYETNPLEFSRRILYDIVEDEAPEAEPGSPGSPPPLENPDSPAYREWENPHSPAYREWENPDQ